MDISTVAKTSLITSFIVACFFELAWDIGSISFITLACFAGTVYGRLYYDVFLCYLGMHSILQKKAADTRDLPVFGVPAHMRGISVLSIQFLKLSMRQILEGRESRRVSFLSI
jgi:hypothetical protein